MSFYFSFLQTADVKYNAGASITPQFFRGPRSLADTFISSPVFNFNPDYSGPLSDTQFTKKGKRLSPFPLLFFVLPKPLRLGYCTLLKIVLNASGWLSAKSAKTFRLSSIPDWLTLCIKTE